MLRIFETHNDGKREVLPEEGVFNVLELGLYELHYLPNEIKPIQASVEGTPIPSAYLRMEDNTFIFAENRYFEDFFGGITLLIDGNTFAINVRIGKLKLSEIEDLFAYLWRKEERFLDAFYAKNSNIEVRQKQSEITQITNFFSFVNTFVSVLEKLLPYFEKQPHFVLRKKNTMLPFNSNKMSPNAIQWILNNLDEIQFDESYKGHYKAIQIKDRYGLIDNISTEVETKDFNTYENQVIMGAFFIIIKRLKALKRDIEIKSNIRNTSFDADKYVDFKDLRRLPFIRLLDEAMAVERKVRVLERRYSSIFANVSPKIEKPVLTSIFSQKPHYKRAYELIKNVGNYKSVAIGQSKLLNISKLSKLYELYNLFQIIDTIKASLKLSLFRVDNVWKKEEPVIEKMAFTNDDFEVNLYYDHKYYGEGVGYNDTLLRRIDKDKDDFYQPDFIIEIINKEQHKHKYYLFDAKYSILKNVRTIHLPSLEKKYLVRTGIYGSRNRKISGLYALFPDTQGEKVVEHPYYEPNIGLIASKPMVEEELRVCIHNILRENLHLEFVQMK